jgi:tetratricopeptide (TPR) repeat protein
MDSLEYIDAYLKGESSPEQARQFEKQLEDDPAFAEEVAFYLSAYMIAKDQRSEDRRNEFREMYRQSVSGAGVIPRQSMVRRIWPALAAAVLLAAIALGWFFFMRPPASTRLADQYISQNLDQLSVKMGGPDSLQTALALYNRGKFPEAQAQLEKILHADPSNAQASLDAGIVSLRMEYYDKALDYFKLAESRTDPRFSPALFYQALVLMKRSLPGDAAHAKQLLQEILQKGLDKKEDAQELLGKM